jgi:predicted cupin superfamily sugar epimerase
MGGRVTLRGVSVQTFPAIFSRNGSMVPASVSNEWTQHFILLHSTRILFSCIVPGFKYLKFTIMDQLSI